MTQSQPCSCLYDGFVTHRRLLPVAHKFTYRVFSILIDIDRLEQIHRQLKLFSAERFNLFSFMSRDHGPRDGSALRPWIETQLAGAGIDAPAKVLIHCFPRLFGYVFNPLSVYYCYGSEDQLQTVVYEVKNTFGGQHCYIAKIDNPDMFDHGTAKNFYVSPFLDLSGYYKFHGHQPGVRFDLIIRKFDKLGCELEASQTGRRAELTDRALLKRLFVYPLMTIKIIGAIHLEALRLWLKGAPRFARPDATSAS